MATKPLLLGVEIGGTKLQVGLGHGDGTIKELRRAAIEPVAGAGAIREAIVEMADRAVWALGLTREAIAAVGIGFGGPVDAARGVAMTSHHVDGWDDFPLAEWAAEQYGGAPVAVENDADTAGLAEARYGAGRGVLSAPLLYVTVGSGVGGGLIRDGRIDRGAGRGAAEIGHLWVEPPDEQGRGGQTVEQLTSGWSIARHAADALRSGERGAETLRGLLDDGDPAEVTAEVVALAAELGDPACTAILDRATRALAIGLADAVTLLGLRRIVLGGGVSMIGEDRWFAPIRRRLDRLVFPPFRGTFDLKPAALGESVVVAGALAIARDALAGDTPTEAAR